MEFGNVPEREIPSIDYTLPRDGAQTVKTFASLSKAENPELYVGASKWGRKQWLGKLYPIQTKEAGFLTAYAKHFNSIELNAVFYSVPSPELITRYKQKVQEAGNENFLFFPKFSRAITHIKRLKNAEEPTELYLSALRNFGDMLGPCFVQMGDNFGPNNFDTLEHYLKQLPKDLRFFCEIRHEEWFSDAANKQAYFAMLAAHNIGTVITDTAGRRDVAHMELSIPEVYIRFVGEGDEYLELDLARVDDWVSRIKSWLDQGLQKAYFMINPARETNTPELCQYAIRQFNKVLGAGIPEIQLIAKSQ